MAHRITNTNNYNTQTYLGIDDRSGYRYCTEILERDDLPEFDNARNYRYIMEPELDFYGIINGTQQNTPIIASYSETNGYVGENGIKIVWSSLEDVADEYDRCLITDPIDAGALGPGGLALTSEKLEDVALRNDFGKDLDAFRLANIASSDSEYGDLVEETISSSSAFDTSLTTAISSILTKGPLPSDLVLFTSANMKQYLIPILYKYSGLFLASVIVPADRFYLSATLNDGTSAGEESGGFVGEGAVNYLLVHKNKLYIRKPKITATLYEPDKFDGKRFEMRVQDFFVSEFDGYSFYCSAAV